MTTEEMESSTIHQIFRNEPTTDIQNKFFSTDLNSSTAGKGIGTTDHETDVTCSAEPFAHCVVKNFLEDKQLVDSLQKTLLQLDYHPKNNDLFKFSQTHALEGREEPAIKSMRSALGMVKDWLSQLLDVQLSDKIDLFSAQYKYTDTLLCHDDELEGRRVAFIYYLVPENWEAADGGALDLFSTDAETGLPESIVKSIVPSRNSFLFFEVTHKSFHQVAEVLSKSKCRLSLSGWFRGPPAIRPEKVCSAEVISKQQAVDIEEEVFYKYISAEYINPATLSEIQETFEVESEIQLQDFFNTSVYERICKDITSDDITWKRIGPAVKRNIEVAELDTLPSSLKECLQFLISDAVLLTLSNITGLKLHHLAPDSEDEDEPESKKSKTSANGSGGGEEMKTGTVSYQVRRWSHGSYTLLHDTQMEQQTECTLEAFVHLNCDSWDEKQGGYTSYVAKGEDEELITVEPRRNCLSLVYKDAEAMGFVKHINHRISETDPPCFYDIALMYHEIEN